MNKTVCFKQISRMQLSPAKLNSSELNQKIPATGTNSLLRLPQPVLAFPSSRYGMPSSKPGKPSNIRACFLIAGIVMEVMLLQNPLSN